jgi:geranylgeranyl diphosphate synthase type II
MGEKRKTSEPEVSLDIRAYLEEKKRLIDAALTKTLPLETGYPSTLCKAIRYSVLNGGKRIRPILALAAFDASEGQGEAIFPFACALELIHTYSLIHDDLPAMDDDDFRRGKPTVHRVFGEAVAILAGDALLSEAFRIMSRAAVEHRTDPVVAVGILHEISMTTGLHGLVGGQAVDLESEGRDVDLPTLEYIHTHKTGALILTALRTGAKVGGASPEKLEAVTRYGERVGLAFQIVDDVLDIVGESSALGKPVGSDEARRKATYPRIVGFEESKRLAENLVEEAIANLKPLGERGEALEGIARYLIERTS